MARRDWIYRLRILQEIILVGLVLDPAPAEVGQKVEAYATALNVGEKVLDQIRRYGIRRLPTRTSATVGGR